MIPLYILFLLYVVLPIIAAVAPGAALKHGLITLSPELRLTSKYKHLGAENYCAALVVTGIALLILLFGFVVAGGSVSKWVTGAVMLLIAASSLTLFIITFKATQIYQRHPTAFKIASSLATVGVVFIANIYADAHLVRSIGVNGSDLPSAHRAVTIMLSIVWWAMLLTFISLGLYFITGLVWTARSINSANDRKKRLSFVMLAGSERHEKSKEHVYRILFVGLAFTALIPINLVQSVAQNKRLDRWANELTVFASFHLGEHRCFTGAVESTRFALVGSDRVIAAAPDKLLGFTYELRRCELPLHQ
ncbi:hypothetical protein [Pseudomonas sp.]|uniref:hypothetical protein n=1 Tax=Pseudomonas sp. OHS18 TaxID=3399679 RepID=UPI0028A0AC77|nr:hypothetical protein [Pseudomonas sp.]